MQSNSNVALHMHLTLSLSSAHVKFDVWTGRKSKHFDITICLILLIWKFMLRVCKWDTPGLWNINFDPEELRGWQQNVIFTSKPLYGWRIYTSCCLLYSSAQYKCRITRPRNSAHQCLVTKINMTILHLIRNPIFKGQRGTQREYSSKPHKHSIVERTLVFKR